MQDNDYGQPIITDGALMNMYVAYMKNVRTLDTLYTGLAEGASVAALPPTPAFEGEPAANALRDVQGAQIVLGDWIDAQPRNGTPHKPFHIREEAQPARDAQTIRWDRINDPVGLTPLGGAAAPPRQEIPDERTTVAEVQQTLRLLVERARDLLDELEDLQQDVRRMTP